VRILGGRRTEAAAKAAVPQRSPLAQRGAAAARCAAPQRRRAERQDDIGALREQRSRERDVELALRGRCGGLRWNAQHRRARALVADVLNEERAPTAEGAVDVAQDLHAAQRIAVLELRAKDVFRRVARRRVFGVHRFPRGGDAPRCVDLVARRPRRAAAGLHIEPDRREQLQAARVQLHRLLRPPAPRVVSAHRQRLRAHCGFDRGGARLGLVVFRVVVAAVARCAVARIGQVVAHAATPRRAVERRTRALRRATLRCERERRVVERGAPCVVRRELRSKVLERKRRDRGGLEDRVDQRRRAAQICLGIDCNETRNLGRRRGARAQLIV
jgi:hypothetical protein